MPNNIVAVEFYADSQPATPGRFTISKPACDLLEASAGDTLAVVITDRETMLVIYAGKEKLKSDNEIYSDDLRKAVKGIGHGYVFPALIRVSPVIE